MNTFRFCKKISRLIFGRILSHRLNPHLWTSAFTYILFSLISLFTVKYKTSRVDYIAVYLVLGALFHFKRLHFFSDSSLAPFIHSVFYMTVFFISFKITSIKTFQFSSFVVTVYCLYLSNSLFSRRYIYKVQASGWFWKWIVLCYYSSWCAVKCFFVIAIILCHFITKFFQIFPFCLFNCYFNFRSRFVYLC